MVSVTVYVMARVQKTGLSHGGNTGLITIALYWLLKVYRLLFIRNSAAVQAMKSLKAMVECQQMLFTSRQVLLWKPAKANSELNNVC